MCKHWQLVKYLMRVVLYVIREARQCLQYISQFASVCGQPGPSQVLIQVLLKSLHKALVQPHLFTPGLFHTLGICADPHVRFIA